MKKRDPDAVHDALRRWFLEDMGLPVDRSRAENTELDEGLCKLGPYLLIELLGQGASGRVFSAVHVALQKKVALKVLAHRADGWPRRAERFRREAMTAGRLNHRNLVGVHDVGNDGDLHYIAMDLVQGQTLDTWCRESATTLEQKLELIAKVARAIAYAHGEGVLHRDLKPQNVLVDQSGEPIVVDFGLARSQLEEHLTLDGSVLGTPRYMAPEQLRGDASALDERADQFALGVLLYEVVTGASPFEGTSSEEIAKNIADRRMVPAAQLQPEILPGLEAVIQTALEPEREHRFETVEAFADDLDRVLRGEPTRFAQTNGLRRLRWRSPAWKRVLGVVLAATTTALLIFVGARFLWQQQRLAHALSIQTTYSDLLLRLENVQREAGGLRHTSGPEERDRLITELEAALATVRDDTGVAAGYRGFILGLLKDERGREIIRRAQEQHPENPLIPLFSARLHLRSYAEEQPWPGDQGIALFEKARPFPRSGQGYEATAALLQEASRELVRARAVCEPATPAGFEWVVDLCDGYESFASGDFESSIEKLKDLASIEDLSVETHLLLALAHCQVGNVAEASAAARELLRRRPNLDLAIQTLALCYAHEGYVHLNKDPETGARLLEEARELLVTVTSDLRKERAVSSLDVAIAIALAKTGKDHTAALEHAIEGMTERIETGEVVFTDLFNRANARLTLSKTSKNPRVLLESALVDLEQAAKLAPDHAVVRASLLQVRMAVMVQRHRAGELERQEFHAYREEIGRYAAMSPNSVEVLYAKGQIEFLEAEHLRIGREDAAVYLPYYERSAQFCSESLQLAPRLFEAHVLGHTARYILFQHRPASIAELRDWFEDARQFSAGARSYPRSRTAKRLKTAIDTAGLKDDPALSELLAEVREWTGEQQSAGR